MATYYVRSAGGNDVNDGLSFANGWATIQKAADTATGGDLALICADGTHLPTAVVDFDTNAGALATPVIFRGASATGDDDGTVATIGGASLGAGADLININIANLHLQFHGLRFTGGKDDNIICGTDSYYMTFMNCRIDTATDDGVYNVSSGGIWRFIRCQIDSNGGQGLAINSASRGLFNLFDCVVNDNTTIGAEIGGGVVVLRTMFIDNGTDGLVLNAASPINIDSCIFFNNTSDGIYAAAAPSRMQYITNCIFRLNGGYGLNTNTGDVDHYYLANCCWNTNTLGNVDINGGTVWGTGHVTGDPLFVSEVDGSENMALQYGSSCKAAGTLGAAVYGGTGYLDIGALQRREPSRPKITGVF